jgi:acetate kinase
MSSMSATPAILCLNSGSSSLKFALYQLNEGLDTLVFTGGIGEHAAPVRWEVWAGLKYVGVQLDPQRNAAHAELVSTPQSSCTVRVIPTNEDLMIACHTRVVLFPRDAKSIQE